MYEHDLDKALCVAVCYVDMMVPPPPPPPPPEPTQGETCQPDDNCENAYQLAVVGGDPCQAARTFKTCAEAAQNLCSEPIPSIVTAITAGAQDAVAEKCNEVSENLPTCAATCIPYEEKALADWADNKQDDGCEQYLLYKTCLSNFELSTTANCKVTNILVKAIATQNDKCPRSCGEYYDDCSANLPKLAADETKLQETCLLWSACSMYDFSACQKSLTVDYSTKCGNVTALASSNKNGNGVSIVSSSLGMVVGMIGVLLL